MAAVGCEKWDIFSLFHNLAYHFTMPAMIEHGSGFGTDALGHNLW